MGESKTIQQKSPHLGDISEAVNVLASTVRHGRPGCKTDLDRENLQCQKTFVELRGKVSGGVHSKSST